MRGLGAGTLVSKRWCCCWPSCRSGCSAATQRRRAIGVIVALAVLAILLAGMMRRRWAWHAGTVLQALLLLAGFLHWSLGALGLMFALVWVYVLHVRRVILG